VSRLDRSLIALGLLLALPAAAAASGTIRVAVVESARAADLAGSGIEVTEAGACPACAARTWRADLVRARARGAAIEVDGRRAGVFRLASERPIRLNGREYPGRLELVRNGDGFAVVAEAPLEDYLVGVLRAESNERWPIEALRAQAIIAVCNTILTAIGLWFFDVPNIALLSTIVCFCGFIPIRSCPAVCW